jgi:hypothetical protein
MHGVTAGAVAVCLNHVTVHAAVVATCRRKRYSMW